MKIFAISPEPFNKTLICNFQQQQLWSGTRGLTRKRVEYTFPSCLSSHFWTNHHHRELNNYLTGPAECPRSGVLQYVGIFVLKEDMPQPNTNTIYCLLAYVCIHKNSAAELL